MGGTRWVRVEVWIDSAGNALQWSVVGVSPATGALESIHVAPVDDPFMDAEEAFLQGYRYALAMGYQLPLFASSKRIHQED